MHILILFIFCIIYIQYSRRVSTTTRYDGYYKAARGLVDAAGMIDDPPAPRVIRKMFEKLKGWGVVEHLGDIRIPSGKRLHSY